MKKILIITSERTGTGHKSASNALEMKLKPLGYDIKQVDAFPLMGKIGVKMENSYIPLTIKHPNVYYFGFWFSQNCSDAMHNMMYMKVKKGLLKVIKEYEPDLIITVHSMFTKAISKLIKKENLNIPFYVVVVDLVKPPHVWFDKRADAMFVPTKTIYDDYINKGFDESKLIEAGFPTRSDIKVEKKIKEIVDKVNILLVNPSVFLQKNIEFAKEISRIQNANINFICGRDEELYKALIEKQKSGELSNEIKIHGFVTNMNEFLEDAHILLTKAGPNMMLESLRSGTVVVATGHIKGQENHNHEFITENGFGVQCEEPSKIFEVVSDMIESKKIDEYLENISKFEIKNGADVVVQYIKERF